MRSRSPGLYTAEVLRWTRLPRSIIARSRTGMGGGWVANVSSRLYMMYSWGVLVSTEEARKVIVSEVLWNTVIAGTIWLLITA